MSTARATEATAVLAAEAGEANTARTLTLVLFVVLVLVTLGLTLFVWGSFYGSWDVAMNVHGSAVEQRAGRGRHEDIVDRAVAGAPHRLHFLQVQRFGPGHPLAHAQPAA